VVMVTHDPRVLSYGDRIIHLEDGLIVGEKSGIETPEHAMAAAIV